MEINKEEKRLVLRVLEGLTSDFFKNSQDEDVYWELLERLENEPEIPTK